MKRVSLTNKIKDIIRPACRGDLSFIANEINKNTSQLWELSGNSSGYLVTRLEKHNNTIELVIVIGVGKNLRPIIDYLCKFSDSNNISSIRTHIVRRGLIKVYQRYGFKVSEIRNNEIVLKRGMNGR